MLGDIRIGGRVKVAVRRDPSVPIGEPAPLYLVCPCGASVPLADIDTDVVCAACGQTFTPDGWLLPKGRP